MEIYAYSPSTKEYLGEANADPNPLEPDSYLIPAFAATVAPPSITTGHVAVYNDVAQTWSQVEDHRGEAWFNGSAPVVIKELGPVPAGYTTSAPPVVPTIDDYRGAVQGQVDATARQHQYNDGVACASYKDSTNASWAAEAATFIAWRDAVWTYAFGELAKVQAGTRSQPAVADFVAELPAIQWA